MSVESGTISGLLVMTPGQEQELEVPAAAGKASTSASPGDGFVPEKKPREHGTAGSSGFGFNQVITANRGDHAISSNERLRRTRCLERRIAGVFLDEDIRRHALPAGLHTGVAVDVVRAVDIDVRELPGIGAHVGNLMPEICAVIDAFVSGYARPMMPSAGNGALARVNSVVPGDPEAGAEVRQAGFEHHTTTRAESHDVHFVADAPDFPVVRRRIGMLTSNFWPLNSMGRVNDVSDEYEIGV